MPLGPCCLKKFDPLDRSQTQAQAPVLDTHLVPPIYTLNPHANVSSAAMGGKSVPYLRRTWQHIIRRDSLTVLAVAVLLACINGANCTPRAARDLLQTSNASLDASKVAGAVTTVCTATLPLHTHVSACPKTASQQHARPHQPRPLLYRCMCLQ